METYTDTWGENGETNLTIKNLDKNGETIYSMHPDFENIEFAEIENIVSTETEEVEYNEEYHLEGVLESVRQIYTELKTELLKESPNLIF